MEGVIGIPINFHDEKNRHSYTTRSADESWKGAMRSLLDPMGRIIIQDRTPEDVNLHPCEKSEPSSVQFWYRGTEGSPRCPQNDSGRTDYARWDSTWDIRISCRDMIRLKQICEICAPTRIHFVTSIVYSLSAGRRRIQCL